MSTDLVDRALAGDRRALARALSIVEAGGPGARELIARFHPHTGRAWIVGVTGPTGTGKSTLVSALTGAYRGRGQRVAVVAVDPTSPFTGGALLGDRIRMADHTLDLGVFVRSMASRRQPGGLASGTNSVVRVFDSCGYDPILIETIGVGQDEVAIAGAALTTLLVHVPGLGDGVQALKAGIMEIAAVHVVNKADHEGVDRTVAELEGAVALGCDRAWVVPIVRTVATTGQGIDELVETIDRHRSHLVGSDLVRGVLLERAKKEIVDLVRHELGAAVIGRDPARLEELAGRVASREVDPLTAAGQILAETLKAALVQQEE